MDYEDVINTCILCPGICTYRCPVYTGSRYTPSKPVNIARAIKRYLSNGDKDFLVNTGYCTLCGSCMESCPVHNPLPKAIAYYRRFIKDTVVLAIENSGRAIYHSRPPIERVEIEGVELPVLDTSEAYVAVSYGYMDRGEANGYTEDLDVFRGPHTIELLQSLGVKLGIEMYTLHLPCKSEVGVEIVEDVFGPHAKVVNGCLGFGGMDLIAQHLRRLLHPPRIDGVVITLCSRSAESLRNMGIDAYTPLEAYLRWRR